MKQEQRTKDKEQSAIHRWLIIAAVVFSVLCSLFAAPVAAQEQPPDLPTYTAWVREAFAAAQRSDRLGLEEAAARLVAATRVRLPEGQQIAVDNSWLRMALAEGEPDLQVIEARLGAILDALAQPPSSAPADARERLNEILNKPPFQQPNPAANTWWDDFWDWVARVLEALVRPVGSVPASASATIGWVILGVGALLLLGLIGYLLIGLRRTIAVEARTDDDPAAGLTARTALDQASQVARSGDYRSAMRYLYISALLWLDERDLLRYDRALTNREYLERLQSNPALRERLRPVVETFDLVWYGHRALDAESFAAYRAQVEALRTES
jgi:hypothetical protein